ncbi:MAG TPA: hypothetical protein PKA21_16975, partial [Kiritimatiellia bacterium]|nr:hypothetical protein [Kiritimatiellia bacterium]
TLARGVAAFLAAGWRTYLTRRDANLRLALGLHGDEMLYSLGMAEDEPDWRYHRDGWKQALRIELMRRWKQTGGSPPLPERPRALKLIGDLLPSDNYTATADPGKADPGVKVGQVAVGCSFVEQPTPKEFRSPIAADPACDAVTELRLFRDSLWVGERPAAEALVMANFCAWEDARCKEIDLSLSMSTDPNGLFRYFRIRFDQWRDYLRIFCDAEVKPTNGVRSFDENVRLVMQREARIPAWSAGLTRWALMAVATFWTMWGTFFWATRIHPWNDPGMARAFWYSWLGLGGVAVAFGLQMIWVHGSLLRAEALARRDILSEYLAYIMTMINRMLRQRGDVLKDRVDEYAQAFEEMVQALADRDTGGAPPRGGPRVNRNPRFTDAAFQTLRERVLPALLARAYSGIREDLNGDARWPLFHHDVWEEVVEKNIAEAVSEEFKQLDYDDLVAAAHWSPQECGNRVKELADDARRAAFHIGAPLVTTPVALLASRGWVAHVSGLPSVTVTDCRLPCLFAVAALPLCIPNFERRGS